MRPEKSRVRKVRTAKKSGRVKRRIVMGEGHPWYFKHYHDGAGYNAVMLGDEPGPGTTNVALNYGDTGNWNRVRLVLEVLE